MHNRFVVEFSFKLLKSFNVLFAQDFSVSVSGFWNSQFHVELIDIINNAHSLNFEKSKYSSLVSIFLQKISTVLLFQPMTHDLNGTSQPNPTFSVNADLSFAN